MNAIQNTSLYRSLVEGGANFEIWDDNYSEGGWAYFSIVAFRQGTARKLAYVRVQGMRVQKRVYDKSREEQWIDVG